MVRLSYSTEVAVQDVELESGIGEGEVEQAEVAIGAPRPGLMLVEPDASKFRRCDLRCTCPPGC